MLFLLDRPLTIEGRVSIVSMTGLVVVGIFLSIFFICFSDVTHRSHNDIKNVYFHDKWIDSGR